MWPCSGYGMENKLNGGDKAGSSMRRLIDSFGEGGDLNKGCGWGSGGGYGSKEY